MDLIFEKALRALRDLLHLPVKGMGKNGLFKHIQHLPIPMFIIAPTLAYRHRCRLHRPPAPLPVVGCPGRVRLGIDNCPRLFS